MYTGTVNGMIRRWFADTSSIVFFRRFDGSWSNLVSVGLNVYGAIRQGINWFNFDSTTDFQNVRCCGDYVLQSRGRIIFTRFSTGRTEVRSLNLNQGNSFNGIVTMFNVIF